jgi:hypothetical protein
MSHFCVLIWHHPSIHPSIHSDRERERGFGWRDTMSLPTPLRSGQERLYLHENIQNHFFRFSILVIAIMAIPVILDSGAQYILTAVTILIGVVLAAILLVFVSLEMSVDSYDELDALRKTQFRIYRVLIAADFGVLLAVAILVLINKS